MSQGEEECSGEDTEDDIEDYTNRANSSASGSTPAGVDQEQSQQQS